MTKVMLKNVRLSFPSLFKTETYQGEDTGNYGASFLLPKSDTETKTKIDDILAEILKKIKVKNIAQIPIDKMCVKDGDTLDTEKYPEYAGHWVIRAKNSVRPKTLNRDKSIIAEDDNILYSGCFVNASIEFWGYSKRSRGISANLRGVQFFKDGERLSGNPVASDDKFDSFDDDFSDDDFNDL